MNIRHIGIVALIIWCLFNVYGAWNVPNWYELIIGSLFLAPFVVGLYILSRSVMKKDVGWQKSIGIAGNVVSISVLVFLLAQITYVLIIYY
jgi:hypothetical protein